MRIVIASDLHYPTINGVATFGRNIARGLIEKGHDVIVIAPSQTGQTYREYDHNHWVYRTVSVPFPFYQNLRISINPNTQVKNIIERFGPDIIHIQTPLGIGRAALTAAKKLDIPVVATNHGMPENLIDNLRLLAPFARPISRLLKEYGSRFYNNMDYVTLPTQAAIDMLNNGDVKVPCSPISNGIDLSRFHPHDNGDNLYKRFSLPTHLPIILYAGRLDAEKHLSALVRAFAAVRQHKPAHLLIVGYGNDSDNLKALARELDIANHVTFTGRVSDDDLPRFYRKASVFVMPSPAELQSLTTLEAMASGLPVVAVRAAALTELCQDGRNGYSCEVDDDAGMANKILAILGDNKLRASMAKESLVIAKQHNLTHVLAQFEEMYKKAIKMHQEKT